MEWFFRCCSHSLLLALAAVLTFAETGSAQAKPAAEDAQVARAVGTIKSAGSDSIVVTADAGGEITASLSASTKILRVPPGEKDLKNAVTLVAQDLQPGDRVLVRGRGSADGHSIAALAVIVMKQGDVSAKQEREREDWQKRGVGGLVSTVDPVSGTITISTGGFGATRKIAVVTAKSTVLRRYAPNSVKFDDAKPAPIDQIKVGDQLRARGTRNADGGELTAEEVVSGTFRNIAGTISAIDTAANTMTVEDSIRKASVVVKVTSDSQMKKLPQEFAQRIAIRLKGAENGAPGAQATAAPSGPPFGAGRSGIRAPGGMANGNGAPDFQRLLSRMPNSTLADLQKGEAVMIVSTDGADTETVTAITMLAGVEAILTATSGRSASTILSPWSLSTSGGEGEGQP
jgi:hypothetical protein